MDSRALMIVLLMLGLAVAPAAQGPDDTARALMPLLKDARRSVEPKLTVAPGTLPPSPITGQSSTLFAVRIGRRSVSLEPEVVEAMERLLAWDSRQPLPPADRALVERWFEWLSVKVLATLAAAGKAIDCDNACVIGHLVKDETLFEGSRAEREERRNELVLDAFMDAVKD